MASDTGNNNMVNNPVDAPDGRAAEAQRLPNNMASHNFYANQGKRDCLRYVLKILIMLAMLAFLIASMVGIYESKCAPDQLWSLHPDLPHNESRRTNFTRKDCG
jgi:hypothetical protein